MKSSNLKTFGYPTILLAALTMLYGFWLVIFPLKTAEPTKQPYKVLTYKVAAGDTFKYEVGLCKYNNAPGTLTRQLVGPELVFVDSEPSSLPMGCTTAIRAVPLPKSITPGKYKMVISIKYNVNVLHTVSLVFQTEEFEIMK